MLDGLLLHVCLLLWFLSLPGRHAAVAGSTSCTSAADKGQRADLAIIEVALFFRSEILAGGGISSSSSPGGAAGEAAAQPVILLTNDNGQLQLSKSHGLPAFRLSGEGEEVARFM
jgi:hypothetical protein